MYSLEQVLAKASAAASTLEAEAWANACALVDAKGDVRVGLPAAQQPHTSPFVIKYKTPAV